MRAAMIANGQHEADVRPWPARAITEPEHVPMHSALATGPLPLRKRSEHHTPLNLHKDTADSHGLHTSPVSSLTPIRSKMSTLSSTQSPGGLSGMPTPPLTPRNRSSDGSTKLLSNSNDIYFDFSRIDYELDRARCIGTGLWSSVHLADPMIKSSKLANESVPTPPSTPGRTNENEPPLCRLFAIKSPARSDAKEVFSQEAKMLRRLQDYPNAQHFIVPFYGIDSRNSCLVFEGVVGGSVEDLCSRLQNMTEVARHLEVRQLFPSMATDLIRGLDFIHAAGIVHADIKPANILLDIDDDSSALPVLRARYIDFSASFVQGEGETANAGGTWDFMAPEQLRIQKDLSEPTYASDVWSVGITLLFLVLGGSPYTAACGDNLFMRREAIKSGDPLSFARMDSTVHKRMAACQDFIDCCRLALQKDRDRRCTAATWDIWTRQQGLYA